MSEQGTSERTSYSTYNGLSHDTNIDEMVSTYAARKGISEVHAARKMLAGELLDQWLDDHLHDGKMSAEALSSKMLLSHSEQSHSLVIRNATIDDAFELSLVHAYTWLTAYSNLMDQFVLDRKVAGVLARTDKMRAGFAAGSYDGHERPFHIVAELDGHVVGFVCYMLPDGLADVHLEIDDAAGELRALYVLEACHGLGAGGMLFDEVANRLREAGCSSMLLDCHHGNDKADGFYRHKGMSQVGFYEGKYGMLDIMQLPLD